MIPAPTCPPSSLDPRREAMAASWPPTGARIWLLACLCCGLLRPTRGYSSGAGRPGCMDMTPRHNAPLQNIHHQYQASRSLPNEMPSSRPSPAHYHCGVALRFGSRAEPVLLQLLVERKEGSLQITLMTTNRSLGFRGFLIRALRVRGSSAGYVRGNFAKDPLYQNVRFIRCDVNENSAVTHTDPSLKQMVVAHWSPFEGTQETHVVFFRATVVLDFNTIWARVDTKRKLWKALQEGGSAKLFNSKKQTNNQVLLYFKERSGQAHAEPWQLPRVTAGRRLLPSTISTPLTLTETKCPCPNTGAM
ncbi:hypothetical protein ISCGN_030491 [Ixodes scapularis]